MLNNSDISVMKSVTTVAPLHPLEDQRLIDLYDYGVFGTPTSSEYDDLVGQITKGWVLNLGSFVVSSITITPSCKIA